jgi:hypothetical protein
MELQPGRALDDEAKRGHNHMRFPAVVPVKDIQSQNISKNTIDWKKIFKNNCPTNKT